MYDDLRQVMEEERKTIASKVTTMATEIIDVQHKYVEEMETRIWEQDIIIKELKRRLGEEDE